MNHDALLDDVAVYALGALPAGQAERVREHLKTCAECRDEYSELRDAVTAVGVSAEASADEKSGATAVSPLLKRRIMREVRKEAQHTPQPAPAGPVGGNVGAMRAVRPIVWPAYAVAAACFVIALFTTVVNMTLNEQVKTAQQEVALMHAQTTQASQTIAQQKVMLADLMAPDARHYPVTHGEVILHGDRLYLAMSQMPVPPKGKVYQAWTLHSGAKEMTPSVTFMPNGSGQAIAMIAHGASGVVAVAVSVEPEGGSKAPTSKPEFVLKLG
jgi:hypothetical protein